MPRVALACVSQDAADAGARVADRGGNAVDAALAASLAAVVTHPGMCSLGGGAFAVVWPAGDDPVAVDGGLEMPGRGLPEEAFGGGRVDVAFDYGGGVTTTVGPGSVATPGLLAACSRAADRFGALPWPELLRPAVERARHGFPLPRACHDFLQHGYRPIYARDPRSRAALSAPDGELLEPGGRVEVEHLARSLEALAEEGVGLFYEGELGARIADHVRSRGGILTREDLAAYEPAERRPVTAGLGGWRVATNPPPALGGVALAAMLELWDEDAPRGWTADAVRRLVRVQAAVLGRQAPRLPPTDDPQACVRELVAAARAGRRPPRRGPTGGSAATLHTSAVDDEGTVCSITLSDGYGSGVVPPDTGIWLNNCLGERELNPEGYHGLEPGTRLPSNMAPTAALGPDGRRLAVGSPGSERIPTAVQQVLLHHLLGGLPLAEAVEHPRLHVVFGPETTRVDAEPGVPLDGLQDRRAGGERLEVRRFAERSMYFGGVEAAAWSPAGGFTASADARRTGGTATGGG